MEQVEILQELFSLAIENTERYNTSALNILVTDFLNHRLSDGRMADQA